MGKRKCCKCWRHLKVVIPLEGHLCPYCHCSCDGCRSRKKGVSSNGIVKRGRPRIAPRQLPIQLQSNEWKSAMSVQQVQGRPDRTSVAAAIENLPLNVSSSENVLSGTEHQYKVSSTFSKTNKQMFTTGLRNQKQGRGNLSSKFSALYLPEPSSDGLFHYRSPQSSFTSSMSSLLISSTPPPLTSSAATQFTTSAASSFTSGISSPALLAASPLSALSEHEGLASTIPTECQSDDSTRTNVKTLEQSSSFPVFGLFTNPSYTNCHVPSKSVNRSGHFWKIKQQGRTIYFRKSAGCLRPMFRSTNVPVICSATTKTSHQLPFQDPNKPLYSAPSNFSQQRDQKIANLPNFRQSSSTLRTVVKQPKIELSSSTPCLSSTTTAPFITSSLPRLEELHPPHQHSSKMLAIESLRVRESIMQGLTKSSPLPDITAFVEEFCAEYDNKASLTNEPRSALATVPSNTNDILLERRLRRFELVKMDVYHLRLIFPDLPFAFITLVYIVNNAFFQSITDLFAIRNTKRVPLHLMRRIRSYSRKYILEHIQ